jgi:hypothetical protein
MNCLYKKIADHPWCVEYVAFRLWLLLKNTQTFSLWTWRSRGTFLLPLLVNSEVIRHAVWGKERNFWNHGLESSIFSLHHLFPVRSEFPRIPSGRVEETDSQFNFASSFTSEWFTWQAFPFQENSPDSLLLCCRFNIFRVNMSLYFTFGYSSSPSPNFTYRKSDSFRFEFSRNCKYIPIEVGMCLIFD